MDETLSAVARLLVRVTVFAELEVPTASLPNDRLVGDTVACSTPFPVSETVCGLLLALSVTVNIPVSTLSNAAVDASQAATSRVTG